MLLLECLLVVQKIILDPDVKCTTWKVEKLETKGDYTEALRRLEAGETDLHWVKEYTRLEY